MQTGETLYFLRASAPVCVVCVLLIQPAKIPFTSKRLRHVEVEQCLVVHRILAQVQADVHAGLHLDAQADAVVGQHALDAHRVGPHEAASAPHHEAQVADDALQPRLLVGVEHLAVFGHHHVRGLVAVLPLVIPAQVEGRARQGVLRQGDMLAEDVLRLCRPGDDLAPPHFLVLPVVQLQAVEVVLAPEYLVVHHAAEVQVHPPVGVGGHVAAVVRQEEAQSGVKVFVPVSVAPRGHVVRLLRQVFARLGEVVVVDVNLRSREEVALAQAEEEPRIDLHPAIPVAAGGVAPQIVPVRVVPDAVIIFYRVLVAELAEDAEAVALEEQLRLGEKVDAPVEHEGDGHGHHRAPQRRVLGLKAEGHQRASAH